MNKISIVLDKKLNHLAWVLVANGIILLLLAVLIVWIPFMLQYLIGLIAIIIGFVFLYSAYRIWHLKNIIDKYFKL
jgi:uncharacterized membrane protein HdeD (DUF308 family)